MTFIINGTELSSDNCLEWEYDYDEIHGYRSVVTEVSDFFLNFIFIFNYFTHIYFK